MQFIDTHCHIHFPDYPFDAQIVIDNGRQAGVTQAILVGTTLEDSIKAVEMAAQHPELFASIGLHPHEAKHYVGNKAKLAKFSALVASPKVIAIGECGLDFFYNHSPLDDQIEILRFQIDLARSSNLPLIFHVREAFDKFWPIFEEFDSLSGVVHSFSASPVELNQILEHGLYVGLNGIMTFTKNPLQLAAAKALPLERMLLETDAPFLTPAPYRGTICQIKHVRVTAEFLSKLRNEELSQIADKTTQNTIKLFKLNKE